MRKIGRCLCLIAIVALPGWPVAQAAPQAISATEASQYFREADALYRADGGALWGVALRARPGRRGFPRRWR